MYIYSLYCIAFYDHKCKLKLSPVASEIDSNLALSGLIHDYENKEGYGRKQILFYIKTSRPVPVEKTGIVLK